MCMICIEITLYVIILFFLPEKHFSWSKSSRTESSIPIATCLCMIKIRRRYCRFSYGRSLINRENNDTESMNFGKINTVIKNPIAKFGLPKHEEIAMFYNQKQESWVMVVLANDNYVTRSPDTKVSTYANNVATRATWQNSKNNVFLKFLLRILRLSVWNILLWLPLLDPLVGDCICVGFLLASIRVLFSTGK